MCKFQNKDPDSIMGSDPLNKNRIPKMQNQTFSKNLSNLSIEGFKGKANSLYIQEATQRDLKTGDPQSISKQVKRKSIAEDTLVGNRLNKPANQIDKIQEYLNDEDNSQDSCKKDSNRSQSQPNTGSQNDLDTPCWETTEPQKQESQNDKTQTSNESDLNRESHNVQKTSYSHLQVEEEKGITISDGYDSQIPDDISNEQNSDTKKVYKSQKAIKKMFVPLQINTFVSDNSNTTNQKVAFQRSDTDHDSIFRVTTYEKEYWINKDDIDNQEKQTISPGIYQHTNTTNANNSNNFIYTAMDITISNPASPKVINIDTLDDPDNNYQISLGKQVSFGVEISFQATTPDQTYIKVKTEPDEEVIAENPESENNENFSDLPQVKNIENNNEEDIKEQMGIRIPNIAVVNEFVSLEDGQTPDIKLDVKDNKVNDFIFKFQGNLKKAAEKKSEEFERGVMEYEEKRNTLNIQKVTESEPESPSKLEQIQDIFEEKLPEVNNVSDEPAINQRSNKHNNKNLENDEQIRINLETSNNRNSDDLDVEKNIEELKWKLHETSRSSNKPMVSVRSHRCSTFTKISNLTDVIDIENINYLQPGLSISVNSKTDSPFSSNFKNMAPSNLKQDEKLTAMTLDNYGEISPIIQGRKLGNIGTQDTKDLLEKDRYLKTRQQQKQNNNYIKYSTCIEEKKPVEKRNPSCFTNMLESDQTLKQSNDPEDMLKNISQKTLLNNECCDKKHCSIKHRAHTNDNGMKNKHFMNPSNAKVIMEDDEFIEENCMDCHLQTIPLDKTKNEVNKRNLDDYLINSNEVNQTQGIGDKVSQKSDKPQPDSDSVNFVYGQSLHVHSPNDDNQNIYKTIETDKSDNSPKQFETIKAKKLLYDTSKGVSQDSPNNDKNQTLYESAMENQQMNEIEGEKPSNFDINLGSGESGTIYSDIEGQCPSTIRFGNSVGSWKINQHKVDSNLLLAPNDFSKNNDQDNDAIIRNFSFNTEDDREHIGDTNHTKLDKNLEQIKPNQRPDTVDNVNAMASVTHNKAMIRNLTDKDVLERFKLMNSKYLRLNCDIPVKTEQQSFSKFQNKQQPLCMNSPKDQKIISFNADLFTSNEKIFNTQSIEICENYPLKEFYSNKKNQKKEKNQMTNLIDPRTQIFDEVKPKIFQKTNLSKVDYKPIDDLTERSKNGDIRHQMDLLKSKIDSREESIRRAQQVFIEFTNSFKGLNTHIQESFNRNRGAIDEKERLFVKEVDDNYNEIQNMYKIDKESLLSNLLENKQLLHTVNDVNTAEQLPIEYQKNCCSDKDDQKKATERWQSSAPFFQRFEIIRQKIYQYELRICYNNWRPLEMFENNYFRQGIISNPSGDDDQISGNSQKNLHENDINSRGSLYIGGNQNIFEGNFKETVNAENLTTNNNQNIVKANGNSMCNTQKNFLKDLIVPVSNRGESSFVSRNPSQREIDKGSGDFEEEILGRLSVLEKNQISSKNQTASTSTLHINNNTGLFNLNKIKDSHNINIKNPAEIPKIKADQKFTNNNQQMMGRSSKTPARKDQYHIQEPLKQEHESDYYDRKKPHVKVKVRDILQNYQKNVKTVNQKSDKKHKQEQQSDPHQKSSLTSNTKLFDNYDILLTKNKSSTIQKDDELLISNRASSKDYIENCRSQTFGYIKPINYNIIKQVSQEFDTNLRKEKQFQQTTKPEKKNYQKQYSQNYLTSQQKDIDNNDSIPDRNYSSYVQEKKFDSKSRGEFTNRDFISWTGPNMQGSPNLHSDIGEDRSPNIDNYFFTCGDNHHRKMDDRNKNEDGINHSARKSEKGLNGFNMTQFKKMARNGKSKVGLDTGELLNLNKKRQSLNTVVSLNELGKYCDSGNVSKKITNGLLNLREQINQKSCVYKNSGGGLVGMDKNKNLYDCVEINDSGEKLGKKGLDSLDLRYKTFTKNSSEVNMRHGFDVRKKQDFSDIADFKF